MIFSHSLALAALLLLPLHQSAHPASILAQADKDFNTSHFAAAADEYRRALKAGAVPPERRDEVEYRFVQSLGRAEEWESAIAEGQAFVTHHKGTLWEPRGLCWMGRLYYALPRSAADALSTGKHPKDGDEPHIVGLGDIRPYGQGFTEWNQIKARDAFEAAHECYGHPETHAQFQAFQRPESIREQIKLDFDLAHLLQWNADYRDTEIVGWPAGSNAYWRIDTASPYQPAWAFPRKILYLYAEIRRLAAHTPNGAHTTALSMLAEAEWLDDYRTQIKGAWTYQRGTHPAVLFPYQTETAQGVIDDLLRKYPDDPVRDLAQLNAGKWWEQQGKYLNALAEYRSLISARPEGAGAKEARERIRVLTWPALALNNPQEGSARATRLHLTYRNAKQVTFRAYRVDPRPLILAKNAPDPSAPDRTAFPMAFGASLPKHRRPDAQWTVTLHDSGDHHIYDQEITLPLHMPGAYAVEATAGGARAVGGAVVTDMVILQAGYAGGSLVYVADRRTGKPRRVTVATRIWPDNGHSETITGRTSADGIFNVRFPSRPPWNNLQLATLAYDDHHFALTPPSSEQRRDNSGIQFHSYTVIEKSVYRPGEPLHFHEMVQTFSAADRKVAAHREMTVSALDQSRKTIGSTSVTTDAFGCANGTIVLPTTAAAGKYQLQCEPRESTVWAETGGESDFWVENTQEQAQLTVTPVAARVALGNPAAVQIHLTGRPGKRVLNTQVPYRIYRDRLDIYPFHDPYNYLSQPYHPRNPWGTLVAAGTATCNSHGDVVVKFATAPDSAYRDMMIQGISPHPKPGSYTLHEIDATDYRFTVKAEVPGPAGRAAIGVGQVEATHHDMGVYLTHLPGYASQGDVLSVTIRTEDMLSHPVATSGVVRIYRGYDLQTDKQGTCVYQQALYTDRHGNGLFRWKTDGAGYHHIVYTTHDTSGRSISGDTFQYVYGPQPVPAGSPGIGLIPKMDFSIEGTTAKMVLVTDVPNSTCLLTIQSNGRVLDWRVVHLKSGSTEITVPVTRRDMPRLFIQGYMVWQGRLYDTFHYQSVLPAHQFATVTVRPEKAIYRPGETATFHLHAGDVRGRPLKAELAFAVLGDAAVSESRDAIMDVRGYFSGDSGSGTSDLENSLGLTGSYDRNIPPDLTPWNGPGIKEPDGMGHLGNGRMGVLMNQSDISGSFNCGGQGGYIMRRQLSEEEESNAGIKAPVDTACWNPAVMTDSHGNATVRFTWPRHAARWRAMAVGTTSSGIVGTGEVRVEVR